MNNTNKNTIYFAPMRDGVIIPTKQAGDVGLDVYASFNEEGFIIPSFESRPVPTGLASSLDAQYFIKLWERGSTGIRNMKVLDIVLQKFESDELESINAGVIDASYRGEWFALIYNANNKPLLITKETDPTTLAILEEEYVIYPYSKAICQAVVLQDAIVTNNLQIQTVPLDELLKIPSHRGDGRLGSSNK